MTLPFLPQERATNQPCNYCKRHNQQLDEQLDEQDINLPSNCSERFPDDSRWVGGTSSYLLMVQKSDQKTS